MDDAYDKTCSQYDFTCNGCEDNCCRSLFFHHTFVEKAYLLHGFKKMAPDWKKTVLQRAQLYTQKTVAPDKTAKSRKLMCPLNKNGRCTLYPYRPMICRLHGLPHELFKPGAPPLKGPGCDAGQFDTKIYIPFDRTLFYREMAQVEMDFRRQKNKTGKIKETIAQILTD